MIDAGATFIALFLALLVYYVMHKRNMRTHWGDTRRGILMLIAQAAIYRLDDLKPDERSWRPHILVLSGSPTTRWYLIELADAVSHGKGFLTVAVITHIPYRPRIVLPGGGCHNGSRGMGGARGFRGGGGKNIRAYIYTHTPSPGSCYRPTPCTVF